MANLEDGYFYTGADPISADTVVAFIKVVNQDAGIIINAEVVITHDNIDDLSGDELLKIGVEKIKEFFD